MKYPKESYERTHWFDGGKGDEYVRLQRQRLVKLRKPHECAGLRMEMYQHPIKSGETALRETALVDGKWAQCYLCIHCMDEWLDELNNVESTHEDERKNNETDIHDSAFDCDDRDRVRGSVRPV